MPIQKEKGVECYRKLIDALGTIIMKITPQEARTLTVLLIILGFSLLGVLVF